MIDTSTKRIWAQVESTLSELLQEGCASTLQAVELAQALEVSKSLGKVTQELALVHGRIITARAQALINALEQGRTPPALQHLNKKYSN
ncbi:MAG: hypothetical protein IJ151_00865 [Bacteroidales bacterium]|nr:hypothetical protein [Bacteroidales bacterium]